MPHQSPFACNAPADLATQENGKAPECHKREVNGEIIQPEWAVSVAGVASFKQRSVSVKKIECNEFGAHQPEEEKHCEGRHADTAPGPGRTLFSFIQVPLNRRCPVLVPGLTLSDFQHEQDFALACRGPEESMPILTSLDRGGHTQSYAAARE